MSADKISFRLSKLLSVDDQYALTFVESEIIDYKHIEKCWIKGKVKSVDNENGQAVISIEAEGSVNK